MKINPKIKEILSEYNDVYYDDAIGYLLAVYFGHRPTHISETLRLRVNATGIIEYIKHSGYKWNVPLFEGAESGAFEWVKTEYVKLFKDANTEKGGKVREATARMKKFFSENPQFRKEDVLEATKMYIMNTDVTYLMLPHYFIEKGKGAVKTYTLLDWLDKLEISKGLGEGRSSTQITMQ